MKMLLAVAVGLVSRNQELRRQAVTVAMLETPMWVRRIRIPWARRSVFLWVNDRLMDRWHPQTKARPSWRRHPIFREDVIAAAFKEDAADQGYDLTWQAGEQRSELFRDMWCRSWDGAFADPGDADGFGDVRGLATDTAAKFLVQMYGDDR